MFRLPLLLPLLLLFVEAVEFVVCMADIGIANTLLLPNISGSEPGQGEYATAEPRPGNGLTRLWRTFNARSLIILAYLRSACPQTKHSTQPLR